MPKSRPPYPAEFRQQIIELALSIKCSGRGRYQRTRLNAGGGIRGNVVVGAWPGWGGQGGAGAERHPVWTLAMNFAHNRSQG
jgi:hypothetical protein